MARGSMARIDVPAADDVSAGGSVVAGGLPMFMLRALLTSMRCCFAACLCRARAGHAAECQRGDEHLGTEFLQDRHLCYGIPLAGIGQGETMTEKDSPRRAISRRLNRIEGQVRGLSRMLDEDRYCIDILHQVQAVKAALKKAETEILRAHAHECVDEALRSGTIGERREKIVELVELFERVR